MFVTLAVELASPGPPVRNFDWGGGGGRRFPRGDFLSQIFFFFFFSLRHPCQ